MRRIAAIALLGLLAACSLSDDLDMVKAESALRSEIARHYGVAVDEVACPDEVAMEDGGTFTCRVTVAGQELPVEATQDDGDGNVTFEATAAVIDVVEKTAELQEAIAAENAGAHLRLYCGDQPVLVLEPGGTFDCLLEGPDLPLRRVVVTVEDVDGATTFTTG